MRGLPPLPDDFVTLEAKWLAGTGRMTTSWRLFAPGATNADASALASLISQWFLTALPDLLSVLPSDASCYACRCSASGIGGQVVDEPVSFNTGTFGATATLNAALVMTWRSLPPRMSAHSHSYLPLGLELVDDDHAHLTDLGWAEAGNAARAYAEHVNALVSPDGSNTVLAVVSRSRAGVPLPTAEWAPVDYGDAARIVGTCDRRIPSRR